MAPKDRIRGKWESSQAQARIFTVYDEAFARDIQALLIIDDLAIEHDVIADVGSLVEIIYEAVAIVIRAVAHLDM